MKAIIYCVLLLATFRITSAQTTYTLVTSGAWNIPDNWLPKGIPGNGDFIIVTDKTLDINDSYEIAGFRLDGGTFSFAGENRSVTITDSADWVHGEIDGDKIANRCSLIVAASAVLVLSTDSADPKSHRLYEGTTLINRGTIRHTGYTGLGIRGLSVLYNEGLFDLKSDADLGGESFSGGSFVNTGTFRKSSGTGVSSINFWWTFFNNGGTIDIRSGTFDFTCDAEFNGGSYNASDGATLSFSSHTITARGTLNGSPAGVILLTDASLSTDSSEVTLNFKGKGFQWEAGTLNGGGSLIIAANSLLELTGNIEPPIITAGTNIINKGTITVSGTKGFNAYGNSYLYNQSLLNVTVDNTFSGTAGGGTIINTGNFRKSGGTGTTTITSWWDFVNDGGTIDVNTGILEFTGDCIFNGGNYTIAGGSEIKLTASTKTFKGVISGSPEGIFRIADATFVTDTIGAVFNIKGKGITWEAGSFTGGGTITLAQGALLTLKGTSESPVITKASVLINKGTIRQEGTASLSGSGGSVVENQSLFEILTDADFSGASGGGTFINKGMLKKTSPGVSVFSSWWDVVNKQGAVIEINSGELEFSDLESEKGSEITGTGVLDVPGGFTNNGIISPGSPVGILNHVDNYSPSAEGELDIVLSGFLPGTGFSQLLITGKAVLNGTLNISLSGGFIPAKGDSFIVLKASGIVSDSFRTITMPSNLKLHSVRNDSSVVVIIDSVGSLVSAAENPAVIVTDYSLSQNYPNPFNPLTNISFAIPENSFVSLQVFNLLGELVGTLVNRELSTGSYSLRWDASELSSGVYIYRIKAGTFEQSRKMLLVR